MSGQAAPMGSGERIIVVDDDASVRDAVRDYLVRHGYRVETASGGKGLDALLATALPDLIILDVMMPDEDGIAICRRLATRGLRILMLSALCEPADRIVGLEIGADDYLVKPFEPRELLARIRALLRRGEAGVDDFGQLFLFSGWRYDAGARSLTDPEGKDVALAPAEHVLLHTLLERAGRLLSREQILELTRGRAAEPFDRAVDLAVSRLRRKLGGEGPRLIETLRGGGYRFARGVRRA